MTYQIGSQQDSLQKVTVSMLHPFRYVLYVYVFYTYKPSVFLLKTRHHTAVAWKKEFSLDEL
jgi:hypothetical protein